MSRADAFDEEAWRAAIGPKNQDYYIERFAKIRAGGGAFRASWHWPAFLVTWYWLLYRKMYGWALAYFFMPVVIGLVVGIVAGLSGSARFAGGGYFLVQAAVALVVSPVIANWLYYRRCAKLVAASEPGLSRERKLARLEARGGTSNIVLIVVGIFGGVALIGMLAAIALPAYQDYTKRAKVSELIVNSVAIAHEFGEEYSRTGAMPADIAQLPSHPALPRFARSVKFNRSLGAIEVDSNLMPYSTDSSIYLVPQLDDNKIVTWKCKASPSMQKLVPKSCREQ